MIEFEKIVFGETPIVNIPHPNKEETIIIGKEKIICNDESIIKFADENINNGNLTILTNVAEYFENKNNIDKMLYYLNIGVEKEDNEALNYIGAYYLTIDDIENSKKYLLKSGNLGNIEAYYNLGLLYKKTKQYKNMEKWLLKAINHEDMEALGILINHYKQSNKYEEIVTLIFNNKFDIKHFKKYVNYDELLYSIGKYKTISKN